VLHGGRDFLCEPNIEHFGGAGAQFFEGGAHGWRVG
jgi:hypothetical protein